MKPLLKFIFFLYGLVPLWLVRLLGLCLGKIAYLVGFRRKILRLQLQRVYLDRELKTAEECAQIERGFYRHFGLLISETLRLAGGDLSYLDQLVEIQGSENLDAAVKRGKGVLILDAHIGNWELAGAAVIRQGYPLGTITKEMKGTGSVLQHLMRNATGLQEFAKKDSIKEIFKALKANKIIVLMVDQNMTVKEGEFVDFMGYPACTITSLAVLAARSGAAVIPASTYRNDDGFTHTTVIWPEIELESPHEDRKKNIVHNTQRFNKSIEAMIEHHPEQWMWIHKRWKTRPNDESENPFDYRNL